MFFGYLDSLERRKSSSLAKSLGYLVIQRPFFSGAKPCTIYAHNSRGPPRGIAGLPGDIFVRKSWGEDSVRYTMGLYDWKSVLPQARHPEEPDFIYNISPTDLTREGWFFQPMTEKDKQEKIHRARVVLKLISTKWGKRSRNEDHRTKGMAILDAMLNGTLELEPKKFIMGGNHTEPYPPNTIISLLGMELDGRSEIEAHKLMESLVEPIVDHKPRGNYASSLNASFAFSSRMMKYALPQIDDETGTYRSAWTFCPEGTVSHLQIDTFGLGRHIYEVGASQTLWLFWPPSKENLAVMARIQDRVSVSVQQLSKLQDGFFAYTAQENEPAAFYVPPYFIFTSLSMKSSAYISLTVFPCDVSFARTFHWMKTEVELLRDGFVLSHFGDRRSTFSAFKTTLKSFMTSKYNSQKGVKLPLGLDGFIAHMLTGLDGKEREEEIETTADYSDMEMD